MPQGSDFYQTQLRKKQRDDSCADKVMQEIDKLSKRVRDLEYQLSTLQRKLEDHIGRQQRPRA